MDRETFKAWLRAYQSAWQQREPESAGELFAEDALVFWTPFDTKKGRGEIVQAWREATERQRNIEFRYEILSIQGDKGIARWWCDLTRLPDETRLRFDGILIATLRGDGLCQFFQEWWHADDADSAADEAPSGDGATPIASDSSR